ncbi:hypothetical protein BaRGS_00024920, partial [Batillaria attramentaria]
DDNSKLRTNGNDTVEGQEDTELALHPNTLVLDVTVGLAMTAMIIAIVVVRAKSGRRRRNFEPAVQMRTEPEERRVVVRQIQTTQPSPLTGYYCTVECQPDPISPTRDRTPPPSEAPAYSDTYESKRRDGSSFECMGGSSGASCGDEMYENKEPQQCSSASDAMCDKYEDRPYDDVDDPDPETESYEPVEVGDASCTTKRYRCTDLSSEELCENGLSLNA